MKQLILLAVFIPAFFAKRMETPLPAHSQKASAEQVLRKVSEKLNGLNSLQYKFKQEYSYSSEGRFHKKYGETYLDFASEDKIVGFRYQVKMPDFITVFNGSERFDCDKKNKTIQVNSKPTEKNIVNFPFYNSPLTLKNALPIIIADATVPKTISDTIIGSTSFYVATWMLNKKGLTYLGAYMPLTQDRQCIYRIIIDKNSYMPIEVFETNNMTQDFTKVSFFNIKENTPLLADSSWYYHSSYYLKDYKLEEPKAENKQLIGVGQHAPEWKLPLFDKETTLTLSQFKGKIVMLEFWDRNCGYCVMAVPKLNNIYSQFKNKPFKLLAINTRDTKESIAIFQEKIKPVYPIIYGGEDVAKNYGVSAVPTIILIDKNGHVIYSGSFIPDQLIALIEKNI